MKAKQKFKAGEQYFSVDTEEIVTMKGIDMPVAKSFAAFGDALRFAQSIGAVEITECEKVDRRNSLVVRTHTVPSIADWGQATTKGEPHA